MVFPSPETVAVYGTLRRGESNHHLLANSHFKGTDKIPDLALYHLGSYPGAIREKGAATEVEVYRVSPATLEMLDTLEDFHPARPRQSLYLRKRVQTRFGQTWLYLYNRPVQARQRLGIRWGQAGGSSMAARPT